MTAPFDSQVTFLPTRSLAETSRFYEEVLGLERVLEQSGCRIWRVSADGFLGACERDAVEVAEGVVFTFVTRDVEGWHRRLADAGVAFEKPLAYNERYDITHCFLRDPSGHLLEIQRFESPRWPGHAPSP